MAPKRKTGYYDSRADDIRFGRILDACWSYLREHDGRMDEHVVLNTYARIIGTLLYEMTPLHSGLISAECVQLRIKNGHSKKTNEHFMGRQKGGDECLKHVSSTMSVDPVAIKAIVDEYRQVHYTSAEENTKLKYTIDSIPGLEDDWKLAYRTVGIRLGTYVPNLRAHKYDLNTFRLP